MADSYDTGFMGEDTPAQKLEQTRAIIDGLRRFKDIQSKKLSSGDWWKSQVSLDTPEDQDAVDVGNDIAIGFTPGLGTLQAGRDFERSRREGSKLGMGLSALGMLPFVGGMTKLVKGAGAGAKAKALRGADNPDMVSVARPTRPGRAEYGDPDTDMLMQNTDRMRMMDGPTLSTSTRMIKNLPFMKNSTASGRQAILTDAVQRGADNAEYIVNKLTSPADVAESRKWYATGNRLSGKSATDAGMDPMVGHAITANYSPGTDWNVNIARQQRLIEMLRNKFDLGEPSARRTAGDYATTLMNNPKSLLQGRYSPKEINDILETPFLDLKDEGRQLVKVMATDAAQNRRLVPSYDPAGNIIDPDYSPITWGSSADLKKIVAILRNPTRETIAENLGGLSKVPSFYNNLAAPKSASRVVTNDTHNMGAVNFLPVGQKDLLVGRGFGALPTGGGRTQGVGGHYGMYNDAIGEAADRLGFLPNETQSVVWETTRKMFDGIKSQKLKDAAVEIWRNEPNANKARDQIVELTKAARKEKDLKAK